MFSIQTRDKSGIIGKVGVNVTMRLGIDISSLPYGTGVSRYTANLVRALTPLLPAPPILFGSSFGLYSNLEKSAQSLGGSAKLYHLPPKLVTFLFHSLNLPIEIFTGSVDVFHAWDWYLPTSKSAEIITTIHDLALFKFPDTAHPEILHHHRQVLTRLKNSNGRVIAVSQSTKDDLVTMMGFDAANITVVHNALPSEQEISVIPEDIAQVKKKYQLTKPYFLIVGTREPRKNVSKMISAWEHFRSEYDCVVVGKEAWGEQKHPRVIYTGYVEGKELAALYQGAKALLYVSLYEGFGLPILEAFYHQLPVVTSNTSSLPEIAGDAASYANPQDVDSIIQSIEAIIEKPEYYKEKGVARLSAFSWEKTAKETLSVYQKVSP